MKRLETVLKIICFLIALVSFTLNLHLPMDNWVWQLVTMIWVAVAFFKSRKVEELEIEKKYRKW